MPVNNIKFKSNIGCMHCDFVVRRGQIVAVFDNNRSWMCPECKGRTSIISSEIEAIGSNIKASKILIHAYHTNSDNKGRLISKTEQDLSELHSLIDEALSYGYYVQITPSLALSEENKNNKNLLLMFSSNRLVQR